MEAELAPAGDARAREALRSLAHREAAGEAGGQVLREVVDPAALVHPAPAALLGAVDRERVFGRARVAAGYALLRAGGRTATLEVAADDGLLAIDEARRAEVRAAGGRPVADAVLAAVRRIRRGEFPIASRDCAGCGFGAVCRFQSAAEAEP